MYDIFIAGARLLVSDEVGAALIEHSRVLTEKRLFEIVDFPTLMDGTQAAAWVTLGVGVQLLAVKTDSDMPFEVEGSEFAAWDIRRRTAALNGDDPIGWDRES